MLNSVKSKGKISSNDKLGLKIVIYCGAAMSILSFIAALTYVIAVKTFDKFYEENSGIIKIFMISLCKWFLNFGNFIPISLILTVELVKTF